jgi:hypothetical protein
MARMRKTITTTKRNSSTLRTLMTFVRTSVGDMLTYSWKKRIPGPVEVTSSTLEVAHDDSV